MATERDITDVVVGDDWDIDRVLGNAAYPIPAGRTVTKAWFTVKNNKSDADAAAVVGPIAITAAATSYGQITDAGSGSPRTARVVFLVPKAETTSADVTAGKSYHYDIQAMLDNGTVKTVDVGRLVAKAGVTDVNA